MAEKNQNQSMRRILGCNRYTSVNIMLRNTGLLSVKQVLFLNTMTLIYKIKEKLISENLLKNTRYIIAVHNYPTRSREDFYVSMISSYYSQNVFFMMDLFSTTDQIKFINVNVQSTSIRHKFKIRIKYTKNS